MPANPPENNEFQQHIIEARQAGYSWGQVSSYVSEKFDEATKAGYSPTDIAKYMGYSDQAPADAKMAASTAATYKANPPTLAPTAGLFEHFTAGVMSSSGGMLTQTALKPNSAPMTFGLSDQTNIAARLLYKTGSLIGDAPAMIAGAFGGGVATAETGPGAVVGAGAGAFALPAYIRSEYADAQRNGQVRSPVDYATRQAATMWETAKQGAVGALTTTTGAALEAPLAAAGIKGVPAMFMKGSAELATMTGATSLMAGKLPSKEELIDNAILMAAAGGAVHVAGGGEPVRAAQDNLSRNWVDTGERPSDAAVRALSDVPTRQTFATPNEAPRWEPPGSAKVVKPNQPSSTITVPRIPGNFESGVAFILKEEGGRMVTDANDAPVKWGINGKAYPGLNIANLSKADAAEIYHRDYWTPMHIDSLPDNMKLPVFDAAVVEGVGKAKELLAESGNDPQKFSELRMEHYRSLVERDPARYGKYMKTWTGRTERAMGGIPLSAGYDLAQDLNGGDAPTSEELKGFDPDADSRDTPGFLSRFAADESGAIGGPRAPKDSGGGTPWDDVAGHLEDAEKPPSMGDTIKNGAYKLYLEMMAPDHPVGKLVDTVSKGGSLAAADNPMFLQRIAESSDSTSKYMLERGMLDTKGNVVGPSLKEILAPHDGETGPRNFWTYATARWAAEKATQAKTTGVNLGNALAVIKDGHADYGQTFQKLVDFQNHTLTYLKDAGVISDASHQQWIADNKARIPGYRVQDDVTHANGGKGAQPGNPIKEALGSTSNVQNIMSSLLKDTFARVSIANHNMVNRAIVDMAAPHGLAEQSAGAPTPVNLSAAAVMPPLDANMNVTMSQVAGAALGKDEIPVMRDGNMEKWVMHDPEITNVLRGYNQQQLGILQKIWGAVGKAQRTGIVLNPMFPVHLLTYDLPFQFITKPGFRNVIAQAMIGGREVFTKGDIWDQWMRQGAPDRILDGLGKDEYIKSVLKGQGDPHLMDNVFNLVNTPVRALRAWGMAMSSVMPVGRFAMDKAVPQEERAYAASEAPFHRSGFGGPVARNMNTGIPFFTAYLNGMEKTALALVGIAKPGEPEINPLHTWLKAAAVITLPILLNEAQNHDKEWYKGVPDYVKDNALVVHVGPDWTRTGTNDENGLPGMQPNGHTFVWKYPPILSTLFGAIPRRLMSQFLEDNPGAWNNFGGSMGEGILPPGGMVPSLIEPFLEHAANWSFFGHHPLVSDSAQKALQTPDQYTMYSSETGKALSRFANDIPLIKDMKLSPPVVDNYIKSWSGTMGEAALQMVDQGVQALGGRQHAPALHFPEDNVFMRSFLTRYPSASEQPLKDWQDRTDRWEKVGGELGLAYKNDDFDTFRAVIAQNATTAGAARMSGVKGVAGPADPAPYSAALAEAQKNVSQDTLDFLTASAALKAEGKTVKYIEGLPNSPNADNPRAPYMTAIEKRQSLDQHYATMQVMAERAVQLADKAGIK